MPESTRIAYPASMFEALVARGFQVEFHSHAQAILSADFLQAVAELEETLSAPPSQ